MSTVFARAADLKVTATVDRTRVGLNQQFQLTVEISGEGAMNAGDPELPDMESFAAYSGSSSSQSMQWINGVMQMSRAMTYYFIARQPGKHRIGPVVVQHKGKTYRSNPIDIEIVKSTAKAPGRPGRVPAAPLNPSADNIADNLFLKAELSSTRVYQNQPLIISYNIYTRVNVTNYGFVNQPNYGNFWSEEFPTPRQPATHEEIINGQRFLVATIKKVALFPTSAGVKVIPPLEVEATVRVRERRARRDIFDSFFDDPFFGRSVTHRIATDSIRVEVLPLPESGRPRNFSGAVGKYAVNVSADRLQAKTNEAISLKVEVAGRGNIKLLPAPQVDIPKSFEVYDPKISEEISRANDQVRGTKTFEYVIIPRREGRFNVGAVTYSFFDPETGRYEVITRPPLHLTISRGKTIAATGISGLSKSEVRLLGEDIRFIAQSPGELVDIRRRFYNMPVFWLVLLFPALVLGAGVLYRHQQDRLRSNVAYARSRKAQKLAQRQLHAAHAAMKNGDVSKFYAEASRALSSYVGNKLNLEEGAMVSEEIVAQLEARNIDGGLIATYEKLIGECDFRRFAMPDAPADAMAQMYQKVRKLIVDLEKAL